MLKRKPSHRKYRNESDLFRNNDWVLLFTWVAIPDRARHELWRPSATEQAPQCIFSTGNIIVVVFISNRSEKNSKYNDNDEK